MIVIQPMPDESPNHIQSYIKLAIVIDDDITIIDIRFDILLEGG